MSLKITFHFHPNVVMGTQIDKCGTEYTNFYEDTMCSHPVHVMYCITDHLAGFPHCEGTRLRTPFFLDNKGILHTPDHIFTNFKIC